MIKDFLLVRAAAGVGFAAAQDYLEHKHAPLALSVSALDREMRRYSMCHVEQQTASELGLYPSMPGLASVVEHMFGGWEGIARFTADAEYLTVVRPDEQYMTEHLMDGAPQFVAVDEEIPLFVSAAHGSLRILDFVRRPSDLTRETFLDQLSKDGEWAASDPRYRAAAAQRVHSLAGEGAASFGGEAEAFDAVVEVWVTDTIQFRDLLDEQRERRNHFCDSERSFSAVTNERRIRG